VSRACQAGWLAVLPRERGRGVRVQLEIRDVSGYSGQRIFCISRVLFMQKILKINQNAEKLYGGMMV